MSHALESQIWNKGNLHLNHQPDAFFFFNNCKLIELEPNHMIGNSINSLLPLRKIDTVWSSL